MFGLYQDGELIMQETTGEDGIAAFNDIPYGEYEIREISAPEGFKKTDKAFKVSITEDSDTITVEINNERIPENPGNPKTGDDSNPILWLALLGVSAAALIGLGVAGKRRKLKKDMEA